MKNRLLLVLAGLLSLIFLPYFVYKVSDYFGFVTRINKSEPIILDWIQGLLITIVGVILLILVIFLSYYIIDGLIKEFIKLIIWVKTGKYK